VRSFRVVLLPLSLLLVNLLIIPEYTGDDAYIHFTYVRNVVENGQVSYNDPSTHSFGSSSILWVLLGSLASLAIRDIPLVMRLLSAVFFLLSVLIMERYLRREFSLSALQQLSALAVLVFNAILFRWILTGMEIGLVLLVVSLFLLFWSPERPVIGGILCLAAYLTRPECAFLPVAIIAASAVDGKSAIRKNAGVIVWTIVFYLGWFLTARLYFGLAFPLTAVKSEYLPDLDSLVRFLRVVTGSYPDLLLLILLAAIPGKQAKGMYRSLPFVERALILFSVAVLLFYVASGTAVISRYLLVVYIPFVLIAVRSLERNARGHWTPRLVPAVVIIQAFLFIHFHYGPIQSFVNGFQPTYAALGQMLRETTPQDTARVMLSDVGIIGFYSRRPIIDRAGLTTRHVYEAGSNDEGVLTRQYHPRYIVAKMHTTGIGEWMLPLRNASGEVEDIVPLYHATIGALGVLSPPGEVWEVYLVEVRYLR
jgi:hypothetical protein